MRMPSQGGLYRANTPVVYQRLDPFKGVNLFSLLKRGFPGGRYGPTGRCAAGLVAFLWTLGLASASAQNTQSVTLAWNPSVGSNVVGYFLYYGASSGVYTNKVNAGGATNATVPGLIQGSTYFFAATAYTAAGLESLSSAEVTYTVPLPGPTDPPAVALTAPSNGASYVAPAIIGLQASVTTNGHTITEVDFYDNSALLGTAASPPYSFRWSNVAAGNYSLSAQALYDSGNSVTSSPVTINVSAPPPPPVVALTTPPDGASYVAPATIDLQADVTTNGHTISEVDFYGNSTLLGVAGSPPYDLTWSNAAAGTYSLSAQALYDSGNSVTSSPVTINVSAPPPNPPVVALTTPPNGASYFAPATIGLQANVTTSGHTISEVDFYGNSTLLGVAGSPPYDLTWSNAAAGTYNLSAQALYDSGNSVTSSPVTITVTALPAPWQTADIGSVGVPGSAVVSNDTYLISGAGTLSGTADSFRYLFQPLTGDGTITTRINSVGNTGRYGRIGVMIRESLASNSEYVFVGISSNGRIRWQRRSSTGGGTSSSSSVYGTPPDVWARIVRLGPSFFGYRSMDGTNWTLVSSNNFSMATNAYIGFAVASGSSNILNLATFTGATVLPSPLLLLAKP